MLFGLEIKCPYSRSLPNSVAEVGADYAMQCFISLYVTGAELWYLFFWEKSSGCHRMFKVTRNDQMFERVRKEMMDSMFRHVIHPEKYLMDEKVKRRKNIQKTFMDEYVNKYNFIII